MSSTVQTMTSKVVRLASTVAHPLRAHRAHHHARERAASELGREYGAIAGRAPRPPRHSVSRGHLALVVDDGHG
jgi:hypothetical protein